MNIGNDMFYSCDDVDHYKYKNKLFLILSLVFALLKGIPPRGENLDVIIYPHSAKLGSSCAIGK